MVHSYCCVLPTEIMNNKIKNIFFLIRLQLAERWVKRELRVCVMCSKSLGLFIIFTIQKILKHMFSNWSNTVTRVNFKTMELF